MNLFDSISTHDSKPFRCYNNFDFYCGVMNPIEFSTFLAVFYKNKRCVHEGYSCRLLQLSTNLNFQAIECSMILESWELRYAGDPMGFLFYSFITSKILVLLKVHFITSNSPVSMGVCFLVFLRYSLVFQAQNYTIKSMLKVSTL